jgi:hypothetical protein
VSLAVSLPWIFRVAIGATVVAAGVYALRSFVMLEGPRAIRAIEWNEEGEWTVCLGATARPWPATLASGSFRLGLRFWVLRFTTPSGTRSVLVEEASRAPQAFRRLSRCLNGQLRRASGRARPPAVTIPPKV